MKPDFVRTAVTPNETNEQWETRFFEAAARTGRLFRNVGDGFTYMCPQRGARYIFSGSDFQGFAHNVLNIVVPKEGPDGWVLGGSFLTETESRTLYNSSVASMLPVLRATVQEPAVVVTPSGPALLRPGYDPVSECYYHVPPGTTPIEPRDSVEHLRTCFSAVPFERPGYLANLMAWLLGGVYLDPLLDPPLLVISGNQQGVGKSSCVQTAGFILSGAWPSPIDFRGSEFMKQLGTRFMESERVMFLDNIVEGRGRAYDNHQLSAILTQGVSKKIRILGHSRSVSATGILFAASLNDAKLSTDLSTRSLLVKLYREKNCRMTPYCKEYAAEHRVELYGELLGLAMRQPSGVHPGDPNFRFNRWLDLVGSRIQDAFGPLALAQVSTIDDQVQEFFHVGADLVNDPNPSIDARRILALVMARPENFPSLHARFSSSPSDHGKLVSAGRLLAARAGDTFSLDPQTTLAFIQLTSASRTDPPTYTFKVA